MSYDSENIFAKIIRGEIPCNKVYEDANVLAFNDISPAAEKHVLVIPKGPYISFDDFVVNAKAEEVSDFFNKVREIANDIGLASSGYRLISNHGSDASQTVAHFHVHILGGQQLGGLIPGDSNVR